LLLQAACNTKCAKIGIVVIVSLLQFGTACVYVLIILFVVVVVAVNFITLMVLETPCLRTAGENEPAG